MLSKCSEREYPVIMMLLFASESIFETMFFVDRALTENEGGAVNTNLAVSFAPDS